MQETIWAILLDNDLAILPLKRIKIRHRLIGYEKYLTLLQTTLTFGFSQAKQLGLEKSNLLNLLNRLIGNSRKFSDFSNSIPA